MSRYGLNQQTKAKQHEPLSSYKTKCLELICEVPGVDLSQSTTLTVRIQLDCVDIYHEILEHIRFRPHVLLRLKLAQKAVFPWREMGFTKGAVNQ